MDYYPSCVRCSFRSRMVRPAAFVFLAKSVAMKQKESREGVADF